MTRSRHEDTEELLARIAGGDAEAPGELLARNRQRLRQYKADEASDEDQQLAADGALAGAPA